MADKLAKTISTILYPGITGAVFTFVLFLGVMDLTLKSFLVAVIYASLITLAPFLIVRFLERKGSVSGQGITVKEERKIFFRTSMPFYILAFLFLLLAGVPKIIFLMGVGVMIFVILYYLISPIYKISVHVGGLAFDIMAMGLILSKSFYFLLPLIPLLAWSRYQLKKHTWGQSFWGTIVGGGIPIVILRLFD